MIKVKTRPTPLWGKKLELLVLHSGNYERLVDDTDIPLTRKHDWLTDGPTDRLTDNMITTGPLQITSVGPLVRKTILVHWCQKNNCSWTKQPKCVCFILSGRFWLGGTDLIIENHWMWVADQTKITTSLFSNWYRTQPDNGNGNEHCMEIQETGSWNDINCRDTRKYICERNVKWYYTYAFIVLWTSSGILRRL